MVTSSGNWAQLIKHANALAEQLKQRRQTVATAESCTGGGISYLLTEIAGSSGWFNGGLITYTNALKQKLLGVSSEVLEQQGAVSKACVEQMARGAMKQCQSDWAIAVNGIAARMNNACRIRHVYHAVDIITCGREDRQWKKDCAYRECGTCSIDQLDHHLEPLLQHQGPVTWTKWESQVSIVNGKRVR